MRKRKARKVRGMEALAEAEYIIKKAQEGVSVVVTRGILCYFSTMTGDAWMLDTEDSFALCLCANGDRQNFRVLQVGEQSVVEWPSKYDFCGEIFVVFEKEGRIREIYGYPTDEIQQNIQYAEQAKQRGKM